MSRRALGILAGVLAAVAVGEGALLWHLARVERPAVLDVRATNAGIALGPGDVRVAVHPAGRADLLVAEGGAGEPVTLAPGRYDVRALFTRSRDNQVIWLRDVRLGRGDRALRTAEFSSGELRVDAQAPQGAGSVVCYVYAHDAPDRLVTSMAAGEPVLIAPGRYDVRAVLTEGAEEKDVRWRREVAVEPGLQTSLQVAFERGSLLVQAVNGASRLPPGAVELSVYRAGDPEREVVDHGLAGTPLALATGRYDVRATFEASSDRPARWLRDVRIDDGGTREIRAEFGSGTVAVAAALPGGEALDDYQVYVYYYRAGEHREAVAYTAAPAPAVLESGRYDIRASFFRSHDRPEVWLRNVLVPVGERVDETVVFDSGRLLVRARDGDGKELVGDEVTVRVHAPGEPNHPVAVARSGERITLSAGRYDVVAEDTRRPGARLWLEDVEVTGGALRERLVIVPAPAVPAGAGTSPRD